MTIIVEIVFIAFMLFLITVGVVALIWWVKSLRRLDAIEEELSGKYAEFEEVKDEADRGDEEGKTAAGEGNGPQTEDPRP